MSDEVATVAWVQSLESRNPELVGQIGRPPTRSEKRAWLRNCAKHRRALIFKKYKYLKSRLQVDMLDYLEFRRSLGYIEGVIVPEWLMMVGRKRKRGATIAGGSTGRINLEPQEAETEQEGK